MKINLLAFIPHKKNYSYDNLVLNFCCYYNCLFYDEFVYNFILSNLNGDGSSIVGRDDWSFNDSRPFCKGCFSIES